MSETNETILLAQGGQISKIPRAVWEGHLAKVPEHGKARLGFMSADHHQVRYFAVREIVRTGEPVRPAHIARALGLSPAKTSTILDDLEQNLFFLCRNEDGLVSWAYPVTADQTPHRLTLSSGERLYAA